MGKFTKNYISRLSKHFRLMTSRSLTRIRFQTFVKSDLHSRISWILLLVIVVAIVGLPIPAKRKPRSDEAYPCQDCACGCSSAEYCWDRCCCHTDHEKLAWARENNVTPPVFLVERVAKYSSAKLDKLVANKRCCAYGNRSDSSPQSAEKRDSTSKSSDVDQDAGVETAITFVTLEDAAQCRGMQLVWSLLSSVVVKLAPPKSEVPDPLLVGWLRNTSDRAISIFLAMDPPVPWFSVSV
jgi:hypothetical protein